MPQPYSSQILDHLPVAGMFESIDIGEVIDQATQQSLERRIVTTGQGDGSQWAGFCQPTQETIALHSALGMGALCFVQACRALGLPSSIRLLSSRWRQLGASAPTSQTGSAWAPERRVHHAVP
jgi:hypothetical protein